MFLFFFTFFLAMPAYVQHRVGVFPFNVALSSRQLTQAYALLSASLLSYLLALSYGIRVKEPRRGSTLSREEGTPKFYTLWAWSIAFGSLCLLLGAGPSTFLTARFDEAAHAAMKADSLKTQLSFIARSTAVLAMVMLLYLVRLLPSGRLRRQNLIALCLYSPVFLFLNFPPALPRFMLFGVVLALCCPFIDFSRPRNKVLTTVCAVPTLLFVFPVIKALGTGDADAVLSAMSDPRYRLDAYLLRVDFDGFLWVVMTQEYLDRGGALRWGMNFIGVALFFVPRAIWPGKPIHTGELVSSALGFPYTNVASPLPAEALVSFGVVGPLVVLACAGYLIARVETEGIVRGGRLSRLFLHAISTAFIVIIARGALNSGAPMFASGFLAYEIMMVTARVPIMWRFR